MDIELEPPHVLGHYSQYHQHPNLYHLIAVGASTSSPRNASWQQTHLMQNSDHLVPAYGGYASLPSSVPMNRSLSTELIQTYTGAHQHFFSAVPSMMSPTLGHAGMFPNTTLAELPPAMALPSAPTTSYPIYSGPSPLTLPENSNHHLNWETALGYTNRPYAIAGLATPSWMGCDPQVHSHDHIAVPSLSSFSNADQLTHGLSLPEPQNVTSQYPASPLPPPPLNLALTSVVVPREHVPFTSHTGPEKRPYFGVYHAPPKFSRTPSHRRKGAARAIQFDGRWVDEEELLGGLVTPEGTISVHECRWDWERSPCHLWVTGDKSCMNAHIQKWHGGKPGGDKVETECRWSNCHKKMNKESIARHVVTIHLGERWWCQGCSDEIVRKDAYGRHVERSSNEACRDAGAFVKCDAGGYVIDCRVVLNSGGEVRYAL